MTPPRNLFFESVEALVAAAARLREQGWQVIPHDRPDQGVVGFLAARDPDIVKMQYAFYGRPLIPSVTICATADEFIKAVQDRAAYEMTRSDSLNEGLFGFVSYARSSEGISEIFRIDIGTLRSGGKPIRDILIDTLYRVRQFESIGLKDISKK